MIEMIEMIALNEVYDPKKTLFKAGGYHFQSG